MEIIIILLVLLVAFDLAALCWGCDSRDSINSPEWEKRRQERTSSGLESVW